LFSDMHLSPVDSWWTCSCQNLFI